MADNIIRSFGDVSIRADVFALIEILTATENWFLKNLGKTTAISTIHSTQVDTLRTPASAAVDEAVNFTISAGSVPTFLTNLVEKVAIPFAVTFTQQLVQHYSGENELARQTQKALMDHGNSMEFDLVRSTLVSGASGTIQKMSGIVQAISKSTNTTAHSSGTTFSASILNGLMQTQWVNSNGNTPTDLFVGPFLRSVIDGFVQKTNQLVQVPVNTINSMIDVYTTSFGNINVHVHRYLTVAGTDATGRVLAVRPETLKIAFLQRPYIQELATTGPADNKAVIGDLTLEVRNQDSNFWASGFDID